MATRLFEISFFCTRRCYREMAISEELEFDSLTWEWHVLGAKHGSPLLAMRNNDTVVQPRVPVPIFYWLVQGDIFLREQHTATPPSSPTHEPTKSFQAYICINKETRSQESLPTSISLLLPKEIQLLSPFLFIQKTTIRTTTTRVLGMTCQLLFLTLIIWVGWGILRRKSSHTTRSTNTRSKLDRWGVFWKYDRAKLAERLR